MRPPRPTFLIIGAQKCGTTWLYEQLRQHPDIFLPAGKDLAFFSYQGHLSDPGFNTYLEHFSEAGEARAVGEATASYFWTKTRSPWCRLPGGFQTDIPKVVHQHLGEELKLIVSLRHPVKRVISAYLHYLAMGEIAPHTDFSEAIKYGGVIDMGFYARHLRNWLEYYPLNRIKVLILESDIQARPVETLSRLCNFLSVPDHDFNRESVEQAVFKGPQRRVNDNGVFIPAPAPSANIKDTSYSGESEPHWQQIMSRDQLHQLNNIFLPDVKDLDSILGTTLVQSWGFTP